MNSSAGAWLVVVVMLLGSSFALANPSMLPQHPGYPMGKAVDPVRGQSLANDPGRKNAVGDKALQKAAAADVDHVTQNLSINRQDTRIVGKPGAGILPRVDGPDSKIDSPVTEATTMTGASK